MDIFSILLILGYSTYKIFLKDIYFCLFLCLVSLFKPPISSLKILKFFYCVLNFIFYLFLPFKTKMISLKHDPEHYYFLFASLAESISSLIFTLHLSQNFFRFADYTTFSFFALGPWTYHLLALEILSHYLCLVTASQSLALCFKVELSRIPQSHMVKYLSYEFLKTLHFLYRDIILNDDYYSIDVCLLSYKLHKDRNHVDLIILHNLNIYKKVWTY